MAAPDTDRNLLFAVIALQDDLIDRAQFADACAGWALRMEVPMADLLIGRGWITAAERDEVDRKLERKVRRHGGDVRASLAVAAGPGVRDAIRGADHPALRQSLAGLPPAEGYVLVETVVPPAAGRRSRYALTHLHAEGGLGKVWVARDPDLNREVALKEIRPDRAGSDDDRRRFLKEAQITGQLEHPNIVPVYELARRPEDDQPYYTMRLVRGQTLRAAIAAHHQARGDRLGLQKLLGAFVAVCQAVGYAHARGVIHRDLKPENVMLGSFGEVIVLDWGLAKRVDRPEHEHDDAPGVHVSHEADSGQTVGIAGTPAYMAPEQAEGRHDLIDARTDVYGLGAILFEILTGRPPVAGATTAEVLRRITEDPPPRPRDLDPTVPKALDAVCRKATSRSRSDRYAGATDLADDVQRWTAGEPVSAYREPWPARARRWAGRHRTAVTTAAAAALVGGLALAGASLALAEANNRERLARRDAEENLDTAKQALERYFTQVSEAQLLNTPGAEVLRTDLLRTGVEFWEKLHEREPTDFTVRGVLARAYGRLAKSLRRTGATDEAVRYSERAIALHERMDRETPDAAALVRSDLAKEYYALANALDQSGKWPEAREACEKSLELVRPFARRFKGIPSYQYEEAMALNLLAVIRLNQGAVDDARAALAEAEAIQVRLAEGHPSEPTYALDLFRTRANLAAVASGRNRLAEARDAFAEALDTVKNLAARPSAPPQIRSDLAKTHRNLATVQSLLGDDRAADAGFAEAVRVQEALHAEFPGDHDHSVELAGHLAEWAGAPVGPGTDGRATVERAGRALALVAEVLGRDPDRAEAGRYRSTARLGLARGLSAQGRHGEALKALEEARDESPGDAQLVEIEAERLRTLARLGRAQEAVALTNDLRAREPGRLNRWRYEGAAAVSVLAGLARGDATAPPESREAAYRANAGAALRLLRDLAPLGYFAENPQALVGLKRHPDLRAVRDHPEFEALLAAIAEKPTE